MRVAPGREVTPSTRNNSRDASYNKKGTGKGTPKTDDTPTTAVTSATARDASNCRDKSNRNSRYYWYSKNIGNTEVRGNSRPTLTAAIDLSTIAGNPAI